MSGHQDMTRDVSRPDESERLSPDHQDFDFRTVKPLYSRHAFPVSFRSWRIPLRPVGSAIRTRSRVRTGSQSRGCG
jgi:hypothetical protein